jgi:hypothetical protein
MTEMKRPWDFWKALLCAQTVISVFYIFYGALLSLLASRNAHSTQVYSYTPTKASLQSLYLTKEFRVIRFEQLRMLWALFLP